MENRPIPLLERILARQQDPQNHDLHFSVGPANAKVKVGCLKTILFSGCPRMEEIIKDVDMTMYPDGIPLKYDPVAFQHFIEFLTLDNWTAEALGQLPQNTLLNLFPICRHLGVTAAFRGLELALGGFLSAFSQFKESPAFYRMTQWCLEAVLSCDKLPLREMEIYDAVIKWGEFRCAIDELPCTDQNLRKVLGGCLREIRFPLMTQDEFYDLCKAKPGLLTGNEKNSVMFFKIRNDGDMPMHFKTKRRSTMCQVLKLNQVYTNVGVRECDDLENIADFQVTKEILLCGVGFFGPVGDASMYHIHLKVMLKKNEHWQATAAKKTQAIRGQKDQVMRVMFEQPIQIKPSADSAWKTCCRIIYTLRGAPLGGFTSITSKEKQHMSCGTEFGLKYFDQNGAIAELFYEEN